MGLPHRSSPAVSRVDARNLAIGAATVAATAWGLADRPTRIASRLDRRAVQRLFDKGD